MMEFRDLRGQYDALQSEIDSAIKDVLRSGQYIGGAQVRHLEAELASYVGVKNCITCGNGTDALLLALMAWGITKGDAVFVPDFTFFSSGEVVSALGATPVFVDVEGRTFNIDPDSLERGIAYIQDKTDLNPRVVVAVDLFGQPADYPRLKDICKNYGLLLLEDGAQGFGGELEGRRACSFGDISTTSFFPAKPLGCYGDGGAVFTDNDEWASLIRSLAVHGKGSMKYDNVRIGMNSRLDAVQAAILRVKLRAFVEHEVNDVNERAAWYSDLLKGGDCVLPIVPDGYRSSWAQYTVILPNGIDRIVLQSVLKEQGIVTNVYYPKPMHEQLAFKGACFSLSCPVTEELCRRVLSLPMGPYLMKSDAQLVASALAQVLGRVDSV